MSFIDYKKRSALKNVDKDIIKNIKSLYIFGTNADQYIIITTDDTVYAFGTNSNGCLGLGHGEGVAKPTKIVELCGKQVTTIAFSSNYEYVLALAKSGFVGTVFSWGRNNFGQLGNGNTTSQYRPVTVNLLTDNAVIDVKCGYAHSLALTQSGSVFLWGLERSTVSVSVTIPRIIKSAMNQRKIVSIDSGIYHSLARTENGEIYFWGDNTYNNNSKPSQPIAQRWSPIPNLANIFITKISCGPNHCLLLSGDGSIYSLGDNSYGQCGNDSTAFVTASVSPTNSCNSYGNYPFGGTSPDGYGTHSAFGGNVSNPINANKNIAQKLDVNEQFTDIGAVKYYSISVGLTVNGNCYVWGECDGQSLTKPLRLPYSNAQNIDDVLDYYAKIRTTFKPILFGETESYDRNPQNLSITDRIRNNFNNKEFSDIAFKIDNKYIFAYKSYLIMVCDHFKKMFTENKWKESREIVKEIKDYSYDVYYAFLKYLHTNTVDINSKDVIGLLDLANCYFEEELKHRCVALLKNQVTLHNYCDIYACAVKFNSSDLKDYCKDFLVNNNNKSVAGKLLDQYSDLKNAKFF